MAELDYPSIYMYVLALSLSLYVQLVIKNEMEIMADTIHFCKSATMPGIKTSPTAAAHVSMFVPLIAFPTPSRVRHEVTSREGHTMPLPSPQPGNGRPPQTKTWSTHSQT